MQLIMLKSSDAITVSLGIARLQSEFATNYGLMMAGATLGAVPIVAVFICFQKYFTQGITAATPNQGMCAACIYPAAASCLPCAAPIGRGTIL